MQIEPIFPQAIIGLNKIEVDFNKVLKYMENVEFEITDASIGNEYVMYMSKSIKIIENISYLKDEIFNNIKNYLNDIMKLKMNFQFTTSWVTKTPPNAYSQKHSHPNSFLSGVYYPKGNKNFNIKFYKKDNIWSIEKTEDNILNASSINFNISQNSSLILFPSDLEHSIEKNLSKENRYSLAFNILPLGEIGYGDSKINFK
jgi:uncharacterized protein (TIGR02466 family)